MLNSSQETNVKKETIHPVKALTGALQLPGDKSISHRYAMLAALAEGTSEFRHFAAARDCHSTLGCMKALGADVAVDGTTVKITGHGLRGLKEQSAIARQAEQRMNCFSHTVVIFDYQYRARSTPRSQIRSPDSVGTERHVDTTLCLSIVACGT